MSEDRVLRLKKPKKKRFPTRHELANAAESVSHTFLSLALFAEMTAKILRAVSRELESNRYKR